jgi:hypothetical protein
MASYWDRTDKRRRLIEERRRELADLQMQLWGWSDQRLRDGFGRLLNPKARQPWRAGGQVMIRTTQVGSGDTVVYVQHHGERCLSYRREGGEWNPCPAGDELRSLVECVTNVVDEQLHDLDPVRVRARRRLQAELARGSNTETYDIASPLYGLDAASRGTSEAEREAA